MARPITPADTEPVLTLARSLGMFGEDEIREIETRLHDHLAGADASIWLVHEEDGIEGIVYCAPEPMTQGTRNALMLLVREDRQNAGRGSMLMNAVEQAVRERNGRIVLVETSGTAEFEHAQRFYGKCGFSEIARIPDFYDDDDDKIVFIKRIRPQATV